ncbi:MAG: hypothetical protein IPN03_02975 [Holophagales bacterium]|nr:hypothetical protein [Holophagales bacterium]
MKDDLLAVPGVRSVESYRAPRLDYRGETIVLASIEMEAMLDRTRHDWVEGSEEIARREVGRGASCTVSDNFARKFDGRRTTSSSCPGARDRPLPDRRRREGLHLGSRHGLRRPPDVSCRI